jgi:ABC-type glycerol-3-phosphate transport system permease component
LINLFPLYYMIVAALQAGGRFFDAGRLLPPAAPAWDNFTRLFTENGFGRLFLNSTMITSIAVAIGSVIAVLAAFAFTRVHSRAAGALFNVTVALLAVPPIVVLVPLFFVGRRRGTDQQLCSADRHLRRLHPALLGPAAEELLRGDPGRTAAGGSGRGRRGVAAAVARRVAVSRAPLVALAVVNALWVWNELLIAIVFLQDENRRTLQAGIAFFAGRNVVDLPLTMQDR